MSYLKDLPCAGCGTKSTYYFPDKPTAHYCYCSFRFEIGEQIAREIEASTLAYIHEDAIRLDNGTWPGLKVIAVEDAAAIARGEK